MRKVTLCLAIFILCIVSPKVQGQAPMDFLIHQYNITIIVDCMDEALVRMGTMPGFELSSRIYVVDGWGQAVRQVSNRDLSNALALLKEQGDVVRSESQATNVFSRWAGLTAEFQVRNREYERLMELLYDAVTMDQFNQIETRLQRVIAGQERIQGQLNNLELNMGNAQIVINLIQYKEEIYLSPEDDPEINNPSRLRRIVNAFTTSADGTFAAVRAVLIFLTYISLPMILLIIVWLVGFRIYKRTKMSKNQGHVTIVKEGESDEKN